MSAFQQPTTSNGVPQTPGEQKVCMHPRVRIVAREEDEEFLECQECGDIFEASELKDMAIEEKSQEQDS